MSFCVDLWNGFDLIKNRHNSIFRKLKSLKNLLVSYISIEAEYCKKLENLYKEHKENTKPEFLLEESFQKLIETFNYEIIKRKEYDNYITKNIIIQINAYLEIPKVKFNKCFSDNNENKEVINRVLTTLKEKQISFHNQCRELGSSIAQNEMDTISKNNKTQKRNCDRLLDSLKIGKEDYLNYLKEANIKRERYNVIAEKQLNKLQDMYKSLIQNLQQSLLNFSQKRIGFLKELYEKEKKDYIDIHSKTNIEKEIFDFIMKNATKEFPMVKFEFCPIKINALKNYIRNKYNKIPKDELSKIELSIQNCFDSNEIFKDEIIFKVNKKYSDQSFSRKISIFNRKQQPANTKESKDEKTEMQKNKEFLENYITELYGYKKKEKKEKNEKEEVKAENNEKNENKDNKDNKDNIDDKENKEIKDDNKNKENKSEMESNKNEIKDNENTKNTKDNESNKNNENKDIDSNEIKEENLSQGINKEINEKENLNKDKENKNATDIKNINNINNKEKITEENKTDELKKKKDDDNNKDEKIEKKDLEKIMKLIAKKNNDYSFYIEVLIKKITYLRSKGFFELDENAYITILSIFDKILEENPKNDYILKNLLILCQTFYKLENGEKIYLQEGIKGREILNNPETWHRVINYSMILNNTDKDLNNFKPNEIIDKINKEAEVVVISYLCDMLQFTDDEKVFNEVKDYYMKVYNLDEKKVNEQVEDYMKSLKKKGKIKNIYKDKDKLSEKEKDNNKSENVNIKNNEYENEKNNENSNILEGRNLEDNQTNATIKSNPLEEKNNNKMNNNNNKEYITNKYVIVTDEENGEIKLERKNKDNNNEINEDDNNRDCKIKGISKEEENIKEKDKNYINIANEEEQKIEEKVNEDKNLKEEKSNE